MSDVASLYPALGIFLVSVAKDCWVWVRSRRSPEEVAAKDQALIDKDKVIAVLEADRDRYRSERNEARAERDTLRRLLEEERLKTLGHAVRMRMDSSIDEAEYEESLPTVIRDRLNIVAPKSDPPPSKTLPPGVKDEVRAYNQDMKTPPGSYAPPQLPPGKPKPPRR